MIEITSLCTGYGKKQVLYDVSFVCESGKLTTLIGPNGCGKSTLLKAVAGILPIESGDVRADGESLKTMDDKKRAKKIAYLSQGKNIPDITVERMVLHGRFAYLSYPRKYRMVDYEAARQAMEKMDVLSLSKMPLCELSGGMRQKVYIAMALCQGADVILLDEPTTYLDISHQFKMYEMCKELIKDGKTILMVSHDIISALKYSDRISVISDGKLAKHGDVGQIVESGVIPKVFGVDILSFKDNGVEEFYYRKAEKSYDVLSSVCGS